MKALAWKASRGDKPLEGSNPSLSEVPVGTLRQLGARDAVEMREPKVEAGARLRFEHRIARNDFAAKLSRKRRADAVVRVHHQIRNAQRCSEFVGKTRFGGQRADDDLRRILVGPRVSLRTRRHASYDALGVAPPEKRVCVVIVQFGKNRAGRRAVTENADALERNRFVEQRLDRRPRADAVGVRADDVASEENRVDGLGAPRFLASASRRRRAPLLSADT